AVGSGSPLPAGVDGARLGLARRGRPVDDEPLDPELVRLALPVCRPLRQRTGPGITRDRLRARLPDAGWLQSISHVAPRPPLALLGEAPQSASPASSGANGR